MAGKLTVFTNLLLVVILTFIFLPGCSMLTTQAPQPEAETENPGSPEQTFTRPGDYFPLTAGSTWSYLGEGNEFASFSKTVLFTEGNRAQMKWENGGTVGAAVFETTDCAVTRIFMQGEEYGESNFLDTPPNEHLIILKAPLAAGTEWENFDGDHREIVDVDATVVTPAGRFERCVKVKITGQNSTTYEYYQEDIGMVKREFISGDARITSSLEEFNIR